MYTINMFILCAHKEQEALRLIIWYPLSDCDCSSYPLRSSKPHDGCRSLRNCLGPAITLHNSHSIGPRRSFSSRTCFVRCRSRSQDQCVFVVIFLHNNCFFASLLYVFLSLYIPLQYISNGWGLSFGHCTMVGGGYPLVIVQWWVGVILWGGGYPLESIV